MPRLHIIPITDANRMQFDRLSQSYIDDTGCITLVEPTSEQAVERFLSTHSGTILAASNPIHLSYGQAFVFSTSGQPPELPIPVSKPLPTNSDPEAKRQYDDYVAKAHSIIVASISGGKVHIGMDPLHNTAIFYRASAEQPWSIMRTEKIPKLQYIEDLLKHPPIKGLKTQLGIHTYDKDGVKTEILTRFYMAYNTYKFLNSIKFHGRSVVRAATMYVRDVGGNVEHVYTPEDFFLDRFQPVDDYHAHHEAIYGKLVDTKLLTLADLSSCEPFVDHDNHFVVYKTRRDKTNKLISGHYLQTDANGQKFIIANDDDTALDYIIRHLHDEQTKPSISAFTSTTPKVEYWQKQNLKLVEKIEAVPQGVKVEFKDKSYILDTGNKLTLHGNTQDEYLEAMVLHAKVNWGAFKIDRASDDVRRKLQKLASKHKVDIVDPNEAGPLRAAQRYLKPLSRIFTADAA